MIKTHKFVDRVGRSDRFWARLMRIGVGVVFPFVGVLCTI